MQNGHVLMISKFKSCTEVRGLQSNLTLAEIKSKETKLQNEVGAYTLFPSAPYCVSVPLDLL
jgi:hypothetical protein